MSEVATKMDPALKAKWLEALRSGKYEQGKNKLKTKDGKYCCLGVLCDISGRGRWKQTETWNGSYYVTPHEEGRERYASTSLPFELAEEYGLVDAQSILQRMNDGDVPENLSGKSFAEIADWIEKNL